MHPKSAALPPALTRAAKQSPAPAFVAVTIQRLAEERPASVEWLVEGDELTATGRALVAVVAASNALARVCLTEQRALDVLGSLERPATVSWGTEDELVRSKRMALLRIAARDLLGMDGLEEVGGALAELASEVLQGAVHLARSAEDPPPANGADAGGGLAVVGMGKLGGSELNYASDVDILFVTGHGANEALARRVLRVASGCFRVDAALRPEGRAGPLTRSLDAYRSYWDRWASAWEFQALLKARPVAGDAELGLRFAAAAAERVWGHAYSAEELAELRSMKARSEAAVAGRGLASREIKRGAGGIRDIEFAVQLLQLVHGRHDPTIRAASTLGALEALASTGYIASEDAEVLARSYRFLRAVEHRLQLVEEEQTHAVPAEDGARARLARVLGFSDDASSSALARFDDELRRCQRDVRAIHERLFFRPLLEAFANLDLPAHLAPTPPTVDGQAPGATRSAPAVMPADAVARRLAAFGFGDPARTRAAVDELAGGLTRSSQLMAQVLPLLLDWLSVTPDPDLGLLGLRNLAVRDHHRALLVSTFRESPEAARRLCLLLGSSRTLAEAIARNPDLIGELGDDDALAPTPRGELIEEAVARVHRRGSEARRRARLVRIRQDQLVRVAARDVLELDDVESVGAALTATAEALVEASLVAVGAEMPLCVVGLGRLGGRELAYASDLDVVFVHENAPGAADGDAEAVAESLLHFVHGASPAERLVQLDLGLRPEGGQGRLTRDLSGYRAYFARWAQTWERQALVRARVVAGDLPLGERFLAEVEDFVWGRPFTTAELADVRRMKARIERERIPPREDAQFHLKLGRGSLSDVEWTVQLLQMQHGVRGTATVATLDELERRDVLAPDDAAALRASYRFCERTRNRWHLVGALAGGGFPGDSLPSDPRQLGRLARSLGTTPGALREEYRKLTRRARRVVERVFYGMDGA